MENETAQEPIIVKIKAPLFNRLIASLIDFIGLGILGFILGLFFKSFFALMENHGVLIGWFISSIYFALGNSRFLSGQTFGKWMSSVKVVDTNGHFLNIKIAIIRSLLFTTPYFLLEYVQQLYIIPNIIQIFLAIITISYYIGLVYFLIFNTQSRQTIHDFVPKTVVIRENQDTENIYFGISRIKIYSYVGVVVLVFISGSFLTSWVGESSNLSEIYDANKEVLIEIATEVNEMENILYIESSKINIDSQVGIVIEAWTNKELVEINTHKLSSEIFEILEEKKFNINRLDYGEIILNYGYDIGIAKSKDSKTWKIEN